MESRQNLAMILEAIKNEPLGMSSTMLSEKLIVPTRTVLRELDNLLKKKQVAKTGKGRAVRYRLATLLPVEYDPSFLRSYRPNATYLLTKDERLALSKLGKRPGSSIELETYNAQIYERLIIDLSWASSKLEGNTYSLLETEKLI